MQAPTAKTLFLIFLSTLAALPVVAQQSTSQKDKHVQGTLIGELTHIEPGETYRLGLLLEHDDDWHTYWKSSTTGYATSIDWDLPEGFSISGISWPTPKVYDFQGITDFVYDGSVLLVVTLSAPDTISAETVEIGFTADWLMCEKVCIPGKISSSIELPVANSPPKESSKWASLFAEADGQMPKSSEQYTFQAWKDGDRIILEVAGESIPEELYFFDSQAVIAAKAETSIKKLSPDRVQLSLDIDPSVDQKPDQLVGVLKSDTGWEGITGPGLKVDIPVGDAPIVSTREPVKISLGILSLAFAGGLILNLMPCVFPVLGIKIMGFVGQAGSSRAKVVLHGLTFTAGVLVSFWILAGILLILRSGGSQLGWGFQLQSPGFVLALAFLLFAFALNMAGLFEIGQSAVGVGSDLTGKQGIPGSFFSGVLATVVATPCAAPFLAPALGAALTMPAASSILVFTLIGLGLATPYLVLSTFPGLIDKLPRPGAWMETFKQFMSFLLFATVAYLLWVLAGQLTESGGYPVFSFLKILMSLVLMSFALWIYGRWGAYHRPKKVRYTGTGIAVLLLAGTLFTGYSGTQPISTEGPVVEWQKWEPGKAESLAADGRIVYVDFTARWCVTCQTNKATVFSSSKVLAKFKELDVIALKADWTNQDPEISQALASFGRSAVPFNLIYGPGLENPRTLPELLTPGIVLSALEEVSDPL